MIILELFESASKRLKLKYEKTSLSKAINVLEKSACRWMVEKDAPFFRGDMFGENHADFSFVDPSKTERRSANTTNHYTLILDNHPMMKDWPKRSRSIIASNDSDKAGDYGELFMIVPLDGSKIGVVRRRDIWDTSIRIFNLRANINHMNEIFDSLEIPDDSWDEFKKSIEDLTLLDVKGHFDKEVGGKVLFDEIIRAYSPSVTKFRMYSASDLPHDIGGFEVWIEGPCLVASYDGWEELQTAWQNK